MAVKMLTSLVRKLSRRCAHAFQWSCGHFNTVEMKETREVIIDVTGGLTGFVRGQHCRSSVTFRLAALSSA